MATKKFFLSLFSRAEAKKNARALLALETLGGGGESWWRQEGGGLSASVPKAEDEKSTLLLPPPRPPRQKRREQWQERCGLSAAQAPLPWVHCECIQREAASNSGGRKQRLKRALPCCHGPGCEGGRGGGGRKGVLSPPRAETEKTISQPPLLSMPALMSTSKVRVAMAGTSKRCFLGLFHSSGRNECHCCHQTHLALKALLSASKTRGLARAVEQAARVRRCSLGPSSRTEPKNSAFVYLPPLPPSPPYC